MRNFPRIKKSDFLTERMGGDVNYYIWDFGPGTHKIFKAIHAANYVSSKGGGYALMITSGNAGRAMNLISEKYPNVQPVSFVSNGDKKINISNLENGKKSITIKIPQVWFDYTNGSLVDFWKRSIWGEKYPSFKKEEDFEKLQELVRKNGIKHKIDYRQAYDVTNSAEFSTNPYADFLSETISYIADNFDLISCPNGSGEIYSAIQQLRDKKKSKARIISVVNHKHPLAENGIDIRTEDALADKLSTPRIGKEHKLILGRIFNNGNSEKDYFYEISNPETKKCNRLFEKALYHEFENSETSFSGSASLAPFLDSKENGSTFKGYSLISPFPDSKGRYETKNQSIDIPNGGKVLLINTGGRN